MLPFGNLKYFNIRLKYRVGYAGEGWEVIERRRGFTLQLKVTYVYFDIIIYKWPPELEITGVRGLLYRDSNTTFSTGTNSNVTVLVNDVKKYAEPYAHIVNNEGYSGPDSIPSFRIGSTTYRPRKSDASPSPGDTDVIIYVMFKNKKTGKTVEISLGNKKLHSIGYGNWADARMKYNWIKDINTVVSS